MKIKNICLAVITIAILISASSVAYYYVVLLPREGVVITGQQKQEQAELEACLSEARTAYLNLNEKECMDMGLEKGCNFGYLKGQYFLEYHKELEGVCRNLYPLGVRAVLNECLSKGQKNIQEATGIEKETSEKIVRELCFKTYIFKGIHPRK